MKRLGFLIVSLYICSVLAAAKPPREYVDCLDRLTEELAGKMEKGNLQKIREECRAIKLLPADQREYFSDFDEYYVQCKAFRLRQIRELGLKEVRSRFASCQVLAELYIDVKNTKAQGRCRVQLCAKTERCSGEWRTYENVEASLCQKVIAPFACMREKQIPEAVLWEDGNEKGKLNCFRI